MTAPRRRRPVRCAVIVAILAGLMVAGPAATSRADGLASGGGARAGASVRLVEIVGSFVSGVAVDDRNRLESGFVSLRSGTTPITLVSFAGAEEAGTIVLRWEITQDSDPVAFHVYRAPAAERPFIRLTTAPLSGEARAYVDATPEPAAVAWYRLSGVDRAGEEFHFGSIPVTSAATPARLRLHQNAPNPAAPATVFAVDLPAAGEVELSLFDVSGRRVARLYNGRLEAGRHSIPWDGSGDEGALASGVYFYRLIALGKVEKRKLILAR